MSSASILVKNKVLVLPVDWNEGITKVITIHPEENYHYKSFMKNQANQDISLKPQM